VQLNVYSKTIILLKPKAAFLSRLGER